MIFLVGSNLCDSIFSFLVLPVSRSAGFIDIRSDLSFVSIMNR